MEIVTQTGTQGGGESLALISDADGMGEPSGERQAVGREEGVVGGQGQPEVRPSPGPLCPPLPSCPQPSLPPQQMMTSAVISFL